MSSQSILEDSQGLVHGRERFLREVLHEASGAERPPELAIPQVAWRELLPWCTTQGGGRQNPEKHSFIPAIDFCQEPDSLLQITSFSMQTHISSSKKERRQGENFVFRAVGGLMH